MEYRRLELTKDREVCIRMIRFMFWSLLPYLPLDYNPIHFAYQDVRAVKDGKEYFARWWVSKHRKYVNTVSLELSIDGVRTGWYRCSADDFLAIYYSFRPP